MMNHRQPSHKRLWISLAFVFVASFAVLGGHGFRITSMVPPIPNKVCTADGRVLFLVPRGI